MANFLQRLNPFNYTLKSFDNLRSKQLAKTNANRLEEIYDMGTACDLGLDNHVALLADYPVFMFNHNTISTLTLDKDTYVRSKFTQNAKKLEKQLKDLGYDKKLMSKCYDVMYNGCGACLLYIDDDSKIKIIPFKIQKNNQITNLIKVNRDFYDNETSIELLMPNGKWKVIDSTQTNYYILYNMKVGGKYVSNLRVASPYIILQNALTERDIEFADGNFTVPPIISPNIDKFLVQDDEMYLQIGGQQIEFIKFIQQGWKTIQKQIQEDIKSGKPIVLPFDVNISQVAGSNTTNLTQEIRKWADEKIQQACFSNGSISGANGTANRSVSEQDRDNVQEITVKIFQDKLARIANDWLIPLLYPYNYNEFEFAFYSEETDETLKKRDQNIKLFQLMTLPDTNTLLQNRALDFKKEDIKRVFKELYNIELEDIDMSEKQIAIEDIGILADGTSETVDTIEKDISTVDKQINETTKELQRLGITIAHPKIVEPIDDIQDDSINVDDSIQYETVNTV